MGQVLSFALGVETAAFNNALGGSWKTLTGFLGSVQLAHVALSGFQDAFARGASLFDQSFRLNSTVKSLYQLEAAFIAVHLPGEAAESMSLRLQRALSGVSETGERTESTFAQLGLNMYQLRQLDPAEQLMQVEKALGAVNAAAAPGLAANIFGRYNAGPALQAARQSQTFNQAFQGGAAGGDLFQQMSAAFAKMEVTVQQIGQKLQLAWAAASKGFIVPMQGILTAIRDFPWQEIGEDIGIAISGLYEAFREGKLSVLIGKTISVGFTMGFEFIFPLVQLLGATLTTMFLSLGTTLLTAVMQPLNYIQASMTWALEKMMQMIAQVPHLRDALGIDKNFKADSFDDILAAQKKTGPQFDYGSGAYGIKEINEAKNDAAGSMFASVGKAFAAATQAAEKDFKDSGLGENFKELAKKAPRLPNKPGLSGGQDGPPPATDSTGALKLSSNSFEKIGAVFNTARNHTDEYARRTATATEGIWAAVRGGGQSLRNHP